jgi:eukaryotic-like serine/threonine-protein kinase
MENLIGKLIDNYRVVSVLGKGGMGIVYKAYDTKLDRYVAIKLLNAQMQNREQFVERFKREAKNQAKLTHPNIVAVYGFIEYSDLLGIVMEYVEGESLEKVIERQGRFNLYDVIYILKQMLLGLGYAHSKGYVHRDIKPSNIILNKEGITKIMDFGISKSLFDKDITQTSTKIGTVYYMSPEQIKGADVTNRSDIYSIACTVFEMISGQPPFDSTNEYEVMDGHLKKTTPKISAKLNGIPEQVDKLLQKAFAKNPLERYPTCEAMLTDVNELDQYVSKLYTGYFQKPEQKPKTNSYKIFAVLSYIAAVFFLIGLSYFAYVQVDELITSNKLDQFKKISLKSLFGPDDKYKFTEIKKVESGTTSNLNAVVFADEKFAVVLSDSNTVLISSNGGNTWNTKLIKTTGKLFDICSFEDGKAIIVGDSSKIFYTLNYLDSVQTIDIPKGYTLFRIKFLDDDTGFITGSNGLILKTTNGGINWYKVETNTKEVLFDIAFIDSKRGFAVGWNGTLLKTINSGESWYKYENIRVDNYLKSVDVTKFGYGVSVGGDGLILRTTNYGKAWEEVKYPDLNGLQKVMFISEDYVVLVGNRGAILVSKDKGETWKIVDSQIYSNMNDIAINPDGNIFIVGVNGLMFKIQ